MKNEPLTSGQNMNCPFCAESISESVAYQKSCSKCGTTFSIRQDGRLNVYHSPKIWLYLTLGIMVLGAFLPLAFRDSAYAAAPTFLGALAYVMVSLRYGAVTYKSDVYTIRKDPITFVFMLSFYIGMGAFYGMMILSR